MTVSSYSRFATSNLHIALGRFKLTMSNVSNQAKPETVEKVCEIVKKQLALPPTTEVSGESKFAALGADSLDTVFHYFSIDFFVNMFDFF